MSFKSLMEIGKKLYRNFIADEITALAAQVAYYLLLSFFPFLIFLVTLISYTNIASMESINLLSNFLPVSVYKLIVDITNNVISTRNRAFLSLGMLATIWGASTGVLAFIYGMNRAYRKKETRPFWKVRGLSIVFTIALSAIFLFSLVLIVFGEILGKYLVSTLKFQYTIEWLWDILRYVISIGTLFLVFILFYIYIPNCKLTAKNVLPGAVLSTVSWLLLSLAFAFYVNNFGHFSSTYGSIGAAIALLIWLYWSSIIVFIGSELNAILYNPGCS